MYISNKQKNSSMDNVKCWNCRSLGHFSDECSSRKRNNNNKNNTNQRFYNNNERRHYLK